MRVHGRQHAGCGARGVGKLRCLTPLGMRGRPQGAPYGADQGGVRQPRVPYPIYLPTLAHTARARRAQEYAYLSQVMGRVVFASEIFNCSAPDTGNMEARRAARACATCAQQRVVVVMAFAGGQRRDGCQHRPDISNRPLQLACPVPGSQRVHNGCKELQLKW